MKLVALAATVMVSLPLARTRPLPVRPLMAPPKVEAPAAQVTTALVTSASAMAPDAPAMAQTWPTGWVWTVSA